MRVVTILIVVLVATSVQAKGRIEFCGRKYSRRVTVIRCVGKGVTDIAVLRGLPRLKKLYLAKNRIRDLKPLSGLRTLRVLDLRRNLIGEIAPLRGHRLWYLKLDHNPMLRSIEALRGNKTLNTLTLLGTGVRDLTPLIGRTPYRLHYPKGAQLCSKTRCLIYPAVSPDGRLIVVEDTPMQEPHSMDEWSPVTREVVLVLNRKGRRQPIKDLRRFSPLAECDQTRLGPGISATITQDDGTAEITVKRRGKVLASDPIGQTFQAFYCSRKHRLIVIQSNDGVTHSEHASYLTTIVAY